MKIVSNNRGRWRQWVVVGVLPDLRGSGGNEGGGDKGKDSAQRSLLGIDVGGGGNEGWW